MQDKDECCETCYIVDPSTIMSDKEILSETYDFRSLPKTLQNPRDALTWLAERGLINNSYVCPNCKTLCHLHKNSQGIDCSRWRCTKCCATKSVRDGTFFSRSHLTFAQILQIMIGWANELDQDCVADKVSVDKKKTIIVWFNHCRRECQKYLNKCDDDLDESERSFRKSIDPDKAINHFLLLLRQNHPTMK